MTPEEIARFEPKVCRGAAGDCWPWVGVKDKDGYGFLMVGLRKGERRTSRRAHRLSYEHERGPIPVGYQLDHLCRNPACVNPAHLEPVTPQVNTLRGVAPSARNAQKTHCLYGHLLPAATHHAYQRTRRRCKQCERARARVVRARDPEIARERVRQWRAKQRGSHSV